MKVVDKSTNKERIFTQTFGEIYKEQRLLHGELMMKINWIYENEAGYWHSSEHRFSIHPDGWRGGVTPDYYTLTDNAAKTHDNKFSRYDTVREAKAAAVSVITANEKRYYG